MKNTCDNTLKSLPNEVLPALGFLDVGQFQFGNITKWKNYKNFRYQFGNFTMGVNNKKVNRYGEFVTERFELLNNCTDHILMASLQCVCACAFSEHELDL